MARGRLRIYLGAAPGVGKTFAMLNEGWRRRQRGTDVIIGVVETHGRPRTLEQLRELEVVPRRSVEHRGSTLTEMDLDAILARRPQLCLVDELAHTNAPGSQHEKRWQDVEALLAAGIDVISTINVQHLESLNDVVERITGVTQRETVPDAVVRAADQIELVDMSPEALRRRMAHGNIYPPERIDAALSNYFRPGNLGALRELALLWVADRVEESLQDYLEQHGIAESWETRERVIVAVSGAAGSDDLIRRGARIARRARGELIAVHVAASDGRTSGTGASSAADGLEARRRIVTDLGGTYREIVADDPATALVAFARAEHATQLVLGTSPRPRWSERLRGSFVQRVIGQSAGIDVHVVAPRDPSGGQLAPHPRDQRATAVFARGRVSAAWAVTALGLPALTAVLVALRETTSLTLPIVLLAYLMLVLAVAAAGGRRVSMIAAVAAAVLENWFFTPPFHTLTIQRIEDGVAIVMFLVVGGTVGSLVERAARQAADARRARAEAESLARTTATLAAAPDPLPGLLQHLLDTFGLDGAAVLCRRADGSGWEGVAAAGAAPAIPGPNALPLRTSEDVADHVLALSGRRLSADDLRVMSVLTGQLGIAIEARRLQDEAETVEQLEQVDATRTALLRAVSHDLRTPLASIKTYVSGLLADDVSWSAEQVHDVLGEIDHEVDRLDRLVGNLLDAGRIETGTTVVQLQPTSVSDVVQRAREAVDGAPLVLDLPTGLPAVSADPALLERVVENLLVNAVRHGSAAAPVRLDAAVVGETVVMRVVDRGPGIPTADRTRVLAPFHRLGDRQPTAGVGLGLAIAQGFVAAMGGTLELDDTPGGGLTVSLTLPLAADEPDGTATLVTGANRAHP